ncbi:MAG: site-2 protease family protein [Candidatus Anstonellaceae archaeon]
MGDENNKKIKKQLEEKKDEKIVDLANLVFFNWAKNIREVVKQKKPNDKKFQNIAALLVMIFSLSLLFYLIDLKIPAIPKIIIITLLLVISGEILIGLKNLEGEFGLIFFKDRKIIEFIDKIAQKYKNIFIFLAESGFILGYGLAGIFLLNRKEKWKTKIIFGLLIFFIFINLILPYTQLALSGSIRDEELTLASKYLKEQNIYEYKIEFYLFENKISIDFATIFYILTNLFGVAGAVFFSISLYSLFIVSSFLIKIFEFFLAMVGKSITSTSLPPAGGTILLPGKNLPLLEGIIAFVVILIVHELAHGILARIYQIKLKSSGIVLFGVLPVGAFVEPDEEQMLKIEKEKQNKILVAGSTSNLYVGLLSFLLILLIMSVTTPYRLDGYYYYDGEKYTKINTINGILPQEFFSKNKNFSFNQTIKLEMENGKNEVIEGQNIDKIKRYYKEWYKFVYKYTDGMEIVEFILNTLRLTFSLNVIVGCINLLFIPFFDGNRIIKNSIENKKLADLIIIINSAAFLLNLLPWLFK